MEIWTSNRWQQVAQLLEGTVITSTVPTPQKLYFCISTPWPIRLKGSKDQTWAKGISLLLCTTGTQTIPLAITPFPDGFHGNPNEDVATGPQTHNGNRPMNEADKSDISLIQG